MAYRLKNLRVLVIDDNMPVRMLIRSILVDLGFANVDMAENTAQGWELYCEQLPDVILVDWRMDQDDALEFIKRIRRDPYSPAKDTPVIMMTGYTNKERVLQARDAGITEFLIKPFTVDTLVNHFTHLIEKPRDFVIAQNFIGPDRRRRSAPTDTEKRETK